MVDIGRNEIIEMLGCGLCSVGDVHGYFRMLNIAENSLTHEAITYFRTFPLKILNHIHILDLHDNQLNKDALDCLAGTLSVMVNLSSLDVSHNPGSQGRLVKLFQEVSNTMIDNLTVHEINLGTKDNVIQALSRLIGSRPTTSLKKLKVGDENMSSECVALLVETLLSASSLEILDLWWIRFTPESANKFTLLE